LTQPARQKYLMLLTSRCSSKRCMTSMNQLRKLTSGTLRGCSKWSWESASLSQGLIQWTTTFSLTGVTYSLTSLTDVETSSRSSLMTSRWSDWSPSLRWQSALQASTLILLKMMLLASWTGMLLVTNFSSLGSPEVHLERKPSVVTLSKASKTTCIWTK
jgi:hypothetical protein